VSNV